MKGKFQSLKDQVVHRASLDFNVGQAEVLGTSAVRLDDFHGYDWIVFESSDGSVDVARFDIVDIDGEIGGGYFCPVEREWASILESESMLNDWGDE